MVNQTKTRTRMLGPLKEEEEIKMKGECVVRCKIKNEEVQEVRLKDVMFVKNARKNLISVKKLCERGAEVKFKGEKFEVKLRGRMIMRGRRDRTGIYALEEEEEDEDRGETENEDEEEEEKDEGEGEKEYEDEEDEIDEDDEEYQEEKEKKGKKRKEMKEKEKKINERK
jgi:hypothetical protein